MYHISKYQGFQNFKLRYVLTIILISKYKETLELPLNVRIILSSNKIYILQNQFVNHFVENLRETTEFEFPYLEVLARRFSVKKMFLEISQNSQENTCARVPVLIKLQAKISKNIFCYRIPPVEASVYFTSSLSNVGNMYSSLANQIAHILTC